MKASEGSPLKRRRKNRTRIEIMTCILRKAEIPARKTQIMYTCGLSSKQETDMLDALQFSDLIEKNEEPRIYQTTKKGHEFLRYYDRLCQLLQTDEMEIPRSRLEPAVVGSGFRNHYSTKQK